MHLAKNLCAEARREEAEASDGSDYTAWLLALKGSGQKKSPLSGALDQIALPVKTLWPRASRKRLTMTSMGSSSFTGCLKPSP